MLFLWLLGCSGFRRAMRLYLGGGSLRALRPKHQPRKRAADERDCKVEQVSAPEIRGAVRAHAFRAPRGAVRRSRVVGIGAQLNGIADAARLVIRYS